MVEWIKQYAVPLIGGLVGLVFAILFLSIGFFKTLLVVLLFVNCGRRFFLEFTR